MYQQILFLPQVQRSMSISNKHGIFEFFHELPNEFRFRIIGN